MAVLGVGHNPRSASGWPHAAQPCSTALLERIEVKAQALKRPCGCAEPTGLVRPDVLVLSDKGCEAILGEIARGLRGGMTSRMYLVVRLYRIRVFEVYASFERRWERLGDKTYGPSC